MTVLKVVFGFVCVSVLPRFNNSEKHHEKHANEYPEELVRCMAC